MQKRGIKQGSYCTVHSAASLEVRQRTKFVQCAAVGLRQALGHPPPYTKPDETENIDNPGRHVQSLNGARHSKT